MKKKNLILLGICVFIFNICNVSASTKVSATLDKCVDGDTAWFIVNNESIKARFLAINTPESTNKIEEYGKEASKYTCDALTNAKKIVLEYDDNSEKKDKYNRELVWVWVDNELLQEKLLEKGLAEIKYLYGDYEYTPRLQEIEKQAKANKLNIWSNYNKDDKLNEMDYFYIGIGIIFLIVLLFTKNGRKKIKKRINSSINKILKFKKANL